MNPDYHKSTTITYTLRLKNSDTGDDYFAKFCSYEGEDRVVITRTDAGVTSEPMKLNKEDGRRIWNELVSEGYILHSTDRSGSKNAYAIFAKTLEETSLNQFKEDVCNSYKEYTFEKEEYKGSTIDCYSLLLVVKKSR